MDRAVPMTDRKAMLNAECHIKKRKHGLSVVDEDAKQTFPYEPLIGCTLRSVI